MSLVSTDARLVKIVKSLSRRPQIDHKKYVRDLIELHKRVPQLSAKGSQLARANVALSADRSRVVQIKLTCLSELLEIRRAHDSLEEYLRVRYTNYLDQYKNKGARDAVVSEALAPLKKRMRPLQGVLDVAEVILDDYDQKGRSVYNSCEALKIGEREV